MVRALLSREAADPRTSLVQAWFRTGTRHVGSVKWERRAWAEATASARRRQPESRLLGPSQPCFYYTPPAGLTPNLRRNAIMGHQLVKADWPRFSPTKAVNRYQ